MDRLPPLDPALQKSFVSVVLGFLGITALILFLPRTLKYLIRRFVLGLVGEIVAVVVSGLLTEKVVAWVGQGDQHSNGQAAPRSTPVTR